MGLYKTPREIMQMTLAEIEILSHHKPDGKSKQDRAIGLLDPEQAAMIRLHAYKSMPPREKIAKRMNERA